MKRINIHDAKTNLSKYLADALAGEEVIIQKAGKPLVILMPYNENASKKRKSGAWKGIAKIGRNFNDPLPREIGAAFGIDNE